MHTGFDDRRGPGERAAQGAGVESPGRELYCSGTGMSTIRIARRLRTAAAFQQWTSDGRGTLCLLCLLAKRTINGRRNHMLIKQIIEVFDLLDSPMPAGKRLKLIYKSKGEDDITVKTIQDGNTPRILSKSSSPERMEGRLTGGTFAPTMGIVGRLGAIGARPEVTGCGP